MDHGLDSRHRNVYVSPTCVASIVDSYDAQGTGLKGKVLPAFPGKDSGYVRECDNGAMDVLDPAVIEYGDLVVDLSNLVSRKRCHLRNLPASASRRAPIKKKRSYRRLYPSKSQVEDILATSRNRRGRMEKLPSYWRLRAKSLPGAYKCSPTKTQPTKGPPTQQSHHCNAGGDQCLKHLEEQMERMECHYGGVAAADAGGGDGYHSATSSLYDENTHFGSGSGPPQNDNLQLEISPGVFAPLRGSDETSNAIKLGFFSNVDCFVCSTSLICIADADYVLCPECRVVGPTGAAERKLPPTLGFNQPHRGGVGLGLQATQASSPASMSHY
jgi:hypothetical protein